MNVASWLGNYELDAVIENDEFARQMEEQYLADLGNTTEVVLDLGGGLALPVSLGITYQRPPVAAGAQAVLPLVQFASVMLWVRRLPTGEFCSPWKPMCFW